MINPKAVYSDDDLFYGGMQELNIKSTSDIIFKPSKYQQKRMLLSTNGTFRQS